MPRNELGNKFHIQEGLNEAQEEQREAQEEMRITEVGERILEDFWDEINADPVFRVDNLKNLVVNTLRQFREQGLDPSLAEKRSIANAAYHCLANDQIMLVNSGKEAEIYNLIEEIFLLTSVAPNIYITPKHSAAKENMKTWMTNTTGGVFSMVVQNTEILLSSQAFASAKSIDKAIESVHEYKNRTKEDNVRDLLSSAGYDKEDIVDATKATLQAVLDSGNSPYFLSYYSAAIVSLGKLCDMYKITLEMDSEQIRSIVEKVIACLDDLPNILERFIHYEDHTDAQFEFSKLKLDGMGKTLSSLLALVERINDPQTGQPVDSKDLKRIIREKHQAVLTDPFYACNREQWDREKYQAYFTSLDKELIQLPDSQKDEIKIVADFIIRSCTERKEEDDGRTYNAYTEENIVQGTHSLGTVLGLTESKQNSRSLFHEVFPSCLVEASDRNVFKILLSRLNNFDHIDGEGNYTEEKQITFTADQARKIYSHALYLFEKEPVVEEDSRDFFDDVGKIIVRLNQLIGVDSELELRGNWASKFLDSIGRTVSTCEESRDVFEALEERVSAIRSYGFTEDSINRAIHDNPEFLCSIAASSHNLETINGSLRWLVGKGIYPNPDIAQKIYHRCDFLFRNQIGSSKSRLESRVQLIVKTVKILKDNSGLKISSLPVAHEFIAELCIGFSRLKLSKDELTIIVTGLESVGYQGLSQTSQEYMTLDQLNETLQKFINLEKPATSDQVTDYFKNFLTSLREFNNLIKLSGVSPVFDKKIAEKSSERVLDVFEDTSVQDKDFPYNARAILWDISKVFEEVTGISFIQSEQASDSARETKKYNFSRLALAYQSRYSYSSSTTKKDNSVQMESGQAKKVYERVAENVREMLEQRRPEEGILLRAGFLGLIKREPEQEIVEVRDNNDFLSELFTYIYGRIYIKDPRQFLNLVEADLLSPSKPNFIRRFEDSSDCKGLKEAFSRYTNQHPVVNMFRRVRKLQEFSSKQESCPWVKEFGPLLLTLENNKVLDWGKQSDLNALVGFVKEMGMINLPTMFKVYQACVSAVTFDDLPKHILDEIEAVGISIKKPDGSWKFDNPQALVMRLKQMRFRLQTGLIRGEVPKRAFDSALGNELFKHIVGTNQWERRDSVTQLLNLAEMTQKSHPEKMAAPPALWEEIKVEESVKGETKETRHEASFVVKKRKSMDDDTQEETKHKDVEEQLRAVLESERFGAARDMCLESFAFMAEVGDNIKSWWAEAARLLTEDIERQERDIKIKLETIETSADGGDNPSAKALNNRKKQLDETKSALTKIRLEDDEDKQTKEQLQNILELLFVTIKISKKMPDIIDQASHLLIYQCMSDGQKRTIQDVFHNPLQTTREKVLAIKTSSDMVTDLISEHYLNVDQDGERTYHRPFDKNLRQYLSQRWYLKTEKNGLRPIESLRRELVSIEQQDDGIMESQDGIEVHMVPAQGLLKVYAGDIGSACYSSKHDGLAKGAYPGLHALVYVTDRGKNNEELRGSTLLIETKRAQDQLPTLVVRANNPKQSFIERIDADRFVLNSLLNIIEMARRIRAERIKDNPNLPPNQKIFI